MNPLLPEAKTVQANDEPWVLPIPDAPINEVFGLTSPRHMLMKLHWEMRQLRQELLDQSSWMQPALYHAYNCAITAWHCADWAWNYDDTKELRADLLRAVGSPKHTATEEEFFTAVCQHSRYAAICRFIANGSKHMRLRRSDGSIKTDTNWSFNLERGTQKMLSVWDGNQNLAAELLFARTAEYWETLFRSIGFLEDKLIRPD